MNVCHAESVHISDCKSSQCRLSLWSEQWHKHPKRKLHKTKVYLYLIVSLSRHALITVLMQVLAEKIGMTQGQDEYYMDDDYDDIFN